MTIPLLKAKWAAAVKSSITDIAILPDKANSKLPKNTFVVRRQRVKTLRSTINGFMFFYKVLRLQPIKQELRLKNVFSDSPESLFVISIVRNYKLIFYFAFI